MQLDELPVHNFANCDLGLSTGVDRCGLAELDWRTPHCASQSSVLLRERGVRFTWRTLMTAAGILISAAAETVLLRERRSDLSAVSVLLKHPVQH